MISSTPYKWNIVDELTQRGWRAGIHMTGPEWLLMTSLTREYISLTVSPVTIAETVHKNVSSNHASIQWGMDAKRNLRRVKKTWRTKITHCLSHKLPTLEMRQWYNFVSLPISKKSIGLCLYSSCWSVERTLLSCYTESLKKIVLMMLVLVFFRATAYML